MDDFDILRELFREDALASAEGNRITLEERNSQSSYTLAITGIPDDTIAFKADMFPDYRHIFKNSRHECRRADYVIVARDQDRDDGRWIVYVEMKRGRGVLHDIQLQLRGARCLVAYCRAIGQEFWGERRFLQHYTERFVRVYDIRLAKRKTRESRSGVHDDPTRMLSIPAPKGLLQFDKLLGAARR